MIYTELTVKAMKTAYNAHMGQTDKCGVPYIFHPYHLAEQMMTEYETCAALLHDVLEDTDITADQLYALFPEEIVNAVVLLTHDKNTEYYDYIRAIKKDPIARAVKLADLEHNSDPDRSALIAEESSKHRERLEKYAIAKHILMEEK